VNDSFGRIDGGREEGKVWEASKERETEESTPPDMATTTRARTIGSRSLS
jgi:hypothetical protein